MCEKQGAHDMQPSTAAFISPLRRYMVVLRAGGVYADIDTECKQPLDTIVRSRDTLIVGWESEFPDAQKALDAW